MILLAGAFVKRTPAIFGEEIIMEMNEIQRTIFLLQPHWNYRILLPLQQGFEDGMNLAVYNALHVLRFEGEINMTAFAEYLGVTKDKMSRLANRLTDSGLVERIIDPLDRRSIRARLTEKGNDYLDRFFEENAGCYRTFLDKLTPEQLEQFGSASSQLLSIFQSVAELEKKESP